MGAQPLRRPLRQCANLLWNRGQVHLRGGAVLPTLRAEVPVNMSGARGRLARPWLWLLAVGLMGLAPIAAHAQQAPATAIDFLRYVDQPPGAERLDTAVVRYQRGAQQVDLIAAVHVGDRAYYRALQKLFGRYDRLLFELVKPADMDARDIGPSEGGVSGLQRLIKDWLGLEFQLDDIDYRPANFVHADLASEKVGQALRDHAGDLLRSLLAYSVADAARLHHRDGTLRLGGMGLAMAMASSDRPRALKRVLGRELAEVDFSTAEFGGLGFGSVLIADRNAAAVRVLERELGKKHKKLAIFYGAAHLPEMEKRLLRLGFTRGAQAWLTAWRIGEKASASYQLP